MKQSAMTEIMDEFMIKYDNDPTTGLVLKERMRKYGKAEVGQTVLSYSCTNQGLKLAFTNGSLTIPSVKRIDECETALWIIVYDQGREKTAAMLENTSLVRLIADAKRDALARLTRLS